MIRRVVFAQPRCAISHAWIASSGPDYRPLHYFDNVTMRGWARDFGGLLGRYRNAFTLIVCCTGLACTLCVRIVAERFCTALASALRSWRLRTSA